MVVVHRAHGFRVVIYTQDHEPAHVHIVGSGRVKINLLGLDGRPEVTEHRDRFMQEWERIHGRSN